MSSIWSSGDGCRGQSPRVPTVGAGHCRGRPGQGQQHAATSPHPLPTPAALVIIGRCCAGHALSWSSGPRGISEDEDCNMLLTVLIPSHPHRRCHCRAWGPSSSHRMARTRQSHLECLGTRSETGTSSCLPWPSMATTCCRRHRRCGPGLVGPAVNETLHLPRGCAGPSCRHHHRPSTWANWPTLVAS